MPVMSPSARGIASPMGGPSSTVHVKVDDFIEELGPARIAVRLTPVREGFGLVSSPCPFESRGPVCARCRCSAPPAPFIIACCVQLSLRYLISVGDREEPAAALMDAFQRYHAAKYVVFIRLTSFLVFVISTALIAMDVNRFSGDLLNAVIAMRVAVVVPVCLGIMAWSFTHSYQTHTQMLGVPLLLLGVVIVAYSIVGRDPGYGTLAVYIVFLYA